MEKNTYTFINVDGQELSVKAEDINEARKELLDVLEWEFKNDE
jgi:hypothetical protein